jgi:hypothetical protein
MRAAALALLAGAACSKSSPPTRTDDVCPAYALRVAETFYVGFERGGPQARYVKPEFIAGVSAGMLDVCKGLPVEHTRCVGRAATATEADACPIEPATLQTLSADMNRIVQAESERVMRMHASPAECAAAAPIQRELMAPSGVALPSVEQFTAVCRDGADWTADFVRCLIETKASGCLSLPGVKADVTKLVQDHLAAQ